MKRHRSAAWFLGFSRDGFRKRHPRARLFAWLVMAAVALGVLGLPVVGRAQVGYDVLYSFNRGADGASPIAPLIQASDGNFYGTTDRGGSFNQGTVFRMTPDGNDTILHSFRPDTDVNGTFPHASLIQASDGNFYGTTSQGGNSDLGTVFQITPDGTVTILHQFTGLPDDGAFPEAPLMQATDGNFYGTTSQGGNSDLGTVFQMTPDGTVAILHAFTGSPGDGALPYAALIQASDGNFYGTTASGGTTCAGNGCGTVFRMTPAGTVTISHAFVGGADGAEPLAALIEASDGNFYGTTQGGGDVNAGTVFRITP